MMLNHKRESGTVSVSQFQTMGIISCHVTAMAACGMAKWGSGVVHLERVVSGGERL